MAKINKQNYNATNKSGFENSPAKVWHVNELVGTTIGYKSIAGFINITAVGTETLTILNNDTEIDSVDITVTKPYGSRYFLRINVPYVKGRYTSLIVNLNVIDSNATFIVKASAMPDINTYVPGGTTEYNINIQQVNVSTGTQINYSMGSTYPQYIYFEIKYFN